jgi:hypothetical protein
MNIDKALVRIEREMYWVDVLRVVDVGKLFNTSTTILINHTIYSLVIMQMMVEVR